MVTNDPNELPDDPPTCLVDIDARLRDTNPVFNISSCANDPYHQLELTTDIAGAITITYSMTLEGARELRNQLNTAVGEVDDAA